MSHRHAHHDRLAPVVGAGLATERTSHDHHLASDRVHRPFRVHRRHHPLRRGRRRTGTRAAPRRAADRTGLATRRAGAGAYPHRRCSRSARHRRERPAGRRLRQAEQARDLRGLLEALDLPRSAVVVGHDIGAMVAFAGALQFPREVSALVLLAALLRGLGLEEAMNVADGGMWHFGFFMAPDVPEMLLDGPELEFATTTFGAMSTSGTFTDDDLRTYAEAYRGRDRLRGGFAHYRTLLTVGTTANFSPTGHCRCRSWPSPPGSTMPARIRPCRCGRMPTTSSASAHRRATSPTRKPRSGWFGPSRRSPHAAHSEVPRCGRVPGAGVRLGAREPPVVGERGVITSGFPDRTRRRAAASNRRAGGSAGLHSPPSAVGLSVVPIARIVRMVPVIEVEPPGHGHRHPPHAVAFADRDQPAVANGVGRVPEP
ncbi:alpha/beta hydrolase [Saccharopolyspora sp. 6V]|nr:MULTISPECIES: alpha/beta hydrolase [unclassified Saccharopolyspora]MCA1194478.1 alpha/beta hydrolase [Saccharopolyspora sp. 6V]MCA1226672.1 alpha/beta hydrolase [Saccharopolyspora sp. 6M]